MEGFGTNALYDNSIEVLPAELPAVKTATTWTPPPGTAMHNTAESDCQILRIEADDPTRTRKLRSDAPSKLDPPISTPTLPDDGKFVGPADTSCGSWYDITPLQEPRPIAIVTAAKAKVATLLPEATRLAALLSAIQLVLSLALNISRPEIALSFETPYPRPRTTATLEPDPGARPGIANVTTATS
jgi:hypothetical protein